MGNRDSGMTEGEKAAAAQSRRASGTTIRLPFCTIRLADTTRSVADSAANGPSGAMTGETEGARPETPERNRLPYLPRQRAGWLCPPFQVFSPHDRRYKYFFLRRKYLQMAIFSEKCYSRYLFLSIANFPNCL